MAARFEAKLGDEQRRPLIELPFDVQAGFGKARAPVVARVNGYELRTTIAVYGSRSYIGLRKEIREAAGVELGDRVSVEVELDPATRTVKIPEDLASAIEQSGVRDAFEGLSFTRRREYVEAVTGARREKTRRRRIERAVEELRALRSK